MLVGQTNTYGQGTWSALLYQAPSYATINGGTIFRAEKAEGTDSGFMGIIQQGGEYSSLYSEPRNCCDQGDWVVGNIAARGTFSSPFASENTVNLTISPDAKHWDVNATCDPNGNNNSSCTLATDQWEYRIFAGEISLRDPNDPQESNISGPLTTDSPLHGTETITFSATDTGPGIAYIKLLVDGTVVQSQIIDTNGGRCVPVAGYDAYTWAYQTPCSTSIGGRTYSLNTTALSNGQHHVQVIVEDAAGNQSEVLNRNVSIENASNGSLGAPPPVPGLFPSAPGSQPPGSGTSILTAGAPNGTNASPNAELQLGLPRRVARPFARRALRIPGRLLTMSDQPIGGATLDVIQRIAGSSSTRTVTHTRTAANGSFAATVPAGPSRLITIAYRAYTGAPGYTAQNQLNESVQAGVQLNVNPIHTSPQGTIVLSGKVQGSIPRDGTIVDLLVHYRGHWVPFKTPRTNRHGNFHVRYQFQGGTGKFPFRAEVPSGQAGFPFATGDSRIINVQTR